MDVLRFLANLVMIAIGSACLMAALGAQGGRWSPRLDILTHFAPFLLAGGLAVAAYALTESGLARTSLLALGLTGAALAGLLIAPEYLRPRSAPAPADAPGQIKLIQFNAWGRNRDVEGTVDWLAAQDADVLVIEESRAIREALIQRTGYYQIAGSATLLILSKAQPLATGIALPPGRWAQPPLARVTLLDAHGPFTVVGTHYTWPTYGGFQQAQGRVTAELLNQFPKERLILAGDFNSTPWSFSRRREDAMFGLERRTRALFTWPAGQFTRRRLTAPFPLLPIDHVYAGPGWRTVKVERGPRLGSDHYPVVVILAAAR